MPERFDFLKEEYLTLRREIEATVLELRQFERNCIIALALTLTWVATKNLDQEILLAGWLVPTLIPMYGAMRSRAIEIHLRVLGQYIKTIEEACIPAGSQVTGWEHHLASSGRGALGIASQRLWIILIFLSFFIGCVGAWGA